MRRALCTVALSIGALCAMPLAHSQDAAARAECERNFSPQSGQAGKDVVWVPTPDSVVNAMLEAAKVDSNDLVYDLGAGDGKIAITAAKEHGARAVGVEFNPKMVQLAQCLAKAAGVTDKVKIIEGDIFETDFSDATVVTLYLLPELNEKLKPTLLKMKPGTRVVSNSFTMGDWQPDERIVVDNYERAYLWIIPEQVEGTWQLQASGAEPVEVTFDQSYQQVDGVATIGDQESKLRDVKLQGDDIEFTFDGRNGPVKVKGTINDDQLQATGKMGEKTVKYSGSRSS